MNIQILPNPRRFAPACAVVTPLLLVIVIRSMLGGVSTAPAGLAAYGPATDSLPVIALPESDQQRRATAWSLEHLSVPPGVSPMDQIDAPPAPVETIPVTDPEPTPVPVIIQATPLDAVKVTSIIGHDHGGFVGAMGRVHRFGEELIPGWKITIIDAKARFIEVTGPDGKVTRLSLIN
ncbi:MAG: hypothetical protein H7210_02220 [Pyrinomonadaceae bacterium]|nr:hypothetical protein [Phycisphaerales bacterium]